MFNLVIVIVTLNRIGFSNLLYAIQADISKNNIIMVCWYFCLLDSSLLFHFSNMMF